NEIIAACQQFLRNEMFYFPPYVRYMIRTIILCTLYDPYHHSQKRDPSRERWRKTSCDDLRGERARSFGLFSSKNHHQRARDEFAKKRNEAASMTTGNTAMVEKQSPRTFSSPYDRRKNKTYKPIPAERNKGRA